MFFLTYLGRELRRRLRQTIVTALGLAVGVGLVLTVTAATTGVKNAQAAVLQALYGIGTDVTVTTEAPPPRTGFARSEDFAFTPGRSTSASTRSDCHPVSACWTKNRWTRYAGCPAWPPPRLG